MSEELKKAILELRDRVEGVERHSGKYPDPWLVDLAAAIEKSVVPKKK
tara:strand:+ start:809 stop:952 length:144 start_codon:yes stop_codon:yes gene_type:complete